MPENCFYQIKKYMKELLILKLIKIYQNINENQHNY